ncbi:hypothetical protein HY972_01670 [Candidatus Kaiserbacteria bacterium]|nr:hypothetical protein [Candidatus Kaiserbacteria bacterium]
MKTLIVVIAMLVVVAALLGLLLLLRSRKQAGGKVGGENGWFMVHLRTTLLVVGGIVLLIAVIAWVQGTPGTLSQALQSPSLKTVWTATKDYWLWIVLIFCIFFVLLFFVSKDWEPKAQKLQRVLVALVLMFFVVVPLVDWIWGKERPSQQMEAQQAPTICPDMSAKEARTCLITPEWSNWVQFADGSVDNGKHPCFPFGVQSERKDEGVTFWRFRVKGGTQKIKYQLFPIDIDCSTVTM